MAKHTDATSAKESDHAARSPYRKARRKKDFAKREGGEVKKGGNKGKGDGQTLYGFNRRTGVRKRCFTWDSGHHLAPNCPSGGKHGKRSVQSRPSGNKPLRPPNSSFSMKSPVRAHHDGPSVNKTTRAIANKPFLPLWIWGQVPLHARGQRNLAPQPIWRVSGDCEIIIRD